MFEILLITGAAGTGKTSTAHEWAASRSSVTAHLSHDNIILFIKTGLASSADAATAEAERQWRIALDLCVAAAAIYAKAGIRCIIDTFLLPAHLAFWRELSPWQVGLVVLYPPVEIAVTRNAVRLEQIGWGVPEWQVYENHAAMAAWQQHPQPLILDNSQLSLHQVVAAIDTWERSGEAIPLF